MPLGGIVETDKLYNADCLGVLKEISSNSIDLLVSFYGYGIIDIWRSLFVLSAVRNFIRRSIGNVKQYIVVRRVLIREERWVLLSGILPSPIIAIGSNPLFARFAKMNL